VTEQIIPKSKRFVTVAAYMKSTGLSYPTVMAAIERGEIRAIQTESGQYRVDTQGGTDTDNNAILRELEKQGQMIAALAGHLGLKV